MKIHILDADHDGSAGQAVTCLPESKKEELRNFLLSIAADADLIYIGNASLRQDGFLNFFNMIFNAWQEGEEVCTNGSVFDDGDLLQALLEGHTDCRVEQLTSTLTTLFSGTDTASTHNPHEEVQNLVKRFGVKPFMELKKNRLNIKRWIKEKGYTREHCCDRSKLLIVLLTIYEASLKHPTDDIVYHLIDDRFKCGKLLYLLFQLYPRIAPHNVSFTFDYCQHSVSKQTLQTKANYHGEPVRGVSKKVPADYKDRLERLTLACCDPRYQDNPCETKVDVAHYLFHDNPHAIDIIAPLKPASTAEAPSSSLFVRERRKVDPSIFEDPTLVGTAKEASMTAQTVSATSSPRLSLFGDPLDSLPNPGLPYNPDALFTNSTLFVGVPSPAPSCFDTGHETGTLFATDTTEKPDSLFARQLAPLERTRGINTDIFVEPDGEAKDEAGEKEPISAACFAAAQARTP